MTSFVRVLAYIELLVFISQLREPSYTSAVVVIRDGKGDLFSVTPCGHPLHCKTRGTPCTCRKFAAECEGPLCCMCRCPAHNFRLTYLDDKSRGINGCMGNSALPSKLNMDQNGMV